MLQRIRDLLEMVRFSHTIFALPFALLAAVMAFTTPSDSGQTASFSWQAAAGILICMVTARNAAMSFNRLVDRKIDGKNPRTANRHIPAGVLSVKSVVLFTLINSGIFVAATLLFLPNQLPIVLSVPVLLTLFAYSLTKRFTALAHFWLGMSLMLAPVCTWIALRGELVMANPADLWPPVVLGIAVLLWVAGFDIIYACQDFEYDVQAKLHSVPSLLGVKNALRLSLVCHLAMIGVLAGLPLLCPQLPFGAIYWTGIALVGILVTYQHWLVRPDDLTRVNLAFFNVNAVISVGLFLVGAADSFF